MINKMMLAVFSAYWKVMFKLDELKNKEDGMETIEAVILVAIAVIIALAIITLLTRNNPTFGEGGLIGYIFNSVKEKIDELFIKPE